MLSAKVVSFEVDPHASEDFLQILDEGLTDVAEAVFTRSQELVAVDEGMLKKSGHVENLVQIHILHHLKISKGGFTGNDQTWESNQKMLIV